MSNICRIGRLWELLKLKGKEITNELLGHENVTITLESTLQKNEDAKIEIEVEKEKIWIYFNIHLTYYFTFFNFFKASLNVKSL